MNESAKVETILIADDNPDNLRVLGNILRRHGYRIRVAVNGKQVLESAQLSPPDLIILDIRMPEMDGYEACRRLKADDRLKSIPVLFLSALAETHDKLQAFDCGGVDFITKPFQSEEVLARVETHLTLSHLRANLEERVRERTAELAKTAKALEEDIIKRKQAEAQLAQSDRLATMGMLAAGVAHEINNPLLYILFNLESTIAVLEELPNTIRQTDRSLQDELIRKLKSALEGTNRIAEIARGLGTFSRVEEDQLVAVEPAIVIEAAINMAYNEIKYRARLVKDFGQLPKVMASEGRLSQVFLNLLINAAHAIDEGDVENNEILVRTWTEGNQICAEVRDTGMGIPAEHLDKIFEPFFTTKKPSIGSGLGLAISKNIVESYSGTIQVSSELGQGTSFIIRLPVPAEEAVPADFHDFLPIEPEVKGRILIVDDDNMTRDVMAQMLGEHETVEAESGASAKHILEEDAAFDVILCDMMMPDLSGADIHQWLLEKNPDLAGHMLFITGGAFTPRAKDYLDKVDNIKLEKPIETSKLRKTVADLIRHTQGRF
jgi:signal transduction histidine kinase